MKAFTDLLPVILFFVAYQFWDIYVATLVAVLTAAAQVAWQYLRRRSVTTVQWVTLGLLVVFGGLTLALHDPTFIKWKPTIVNWLFAVAFFASGWLLERPLLQRMLEHAIRLPDAAWQRLNLAWVVFFLGAGVANLVVAYRFSEATWVNFKLFGLTGLTLLFVLGQGFYVARHAEAANLAGD